MRLRITFDVDVDERAVRRYIRRWPLLQQDVTAADVLENEALAAWDNEGLLRQGSEVRVTSDDGKENE
jgi:hypothetical protein